MPDALRRERDVRHATAEETQQPRDHEPTAIELAKHAGQDRHHQECRKTGEQHDRARLLRVVSGDGGEELRQQVGHAVEPGADRRNNQDDAGKVLVEQQPQPYDRCLRRELADDHHQDAGRGDER